MRLPSRYRSRLFAAISLSGSVAHSEAQADTAPSCGSEGMDFDYRSLVCKTDHNHFLSGSATPPRNAPQEAYPRRSVKIRICGFALLPICGVWAGVLTGPIAFLATMMIMPFGRLMAAIKRLPGAANCPCPQTSTLSRRYVGATDSAGVGECQAE